MTNALRNLIVLLTTCLVICLGSCASIVDTRPVAPDAKIVLTQRANDVWLVDMTFVQPIPGFIFVRSAENYRAKTWTPISEGAVLETINSMDAVFFTKPEFQAQFEIRPETGGVNRRLLTAMEFGDGGTAFFTEEFYIAPIDSREQVESFGGKITKWRGRVPSVELKINPIDPLVSTKKFADGAPIEFVIGQDVIDPIYIGPSGILETENFTGVVDAATPAWLRQRLDGDLGRIFNQLDQTWGESLPAPPFILISYDGSAKRRYSYKGAAYENNLLRLEIRGRAYQKQTRSLLQALHWFLAHESVHLYQSNSEARPSSTKYAWAVEGIANEIAGQILIDEGLIDENYMQTRYRDYYSGCKDVLGSGMAFGGKLSQSKYYDCGSLIALVTDKALPNDSLADFWKTLSENSKARFGGTKLYDSDVYFKTMKDMGAREDIIESLRVITQEKMENADLNALGRDVTDELIKVMDAAGLAPAFTPTGGLKSLSWQ